MHTKLSKIKKFPERKGADSKINIPDKQENKIIVHPSTKVNNDKFKENDIDEVNDYDLKSSEITQSLDNFEMTLKSKGLYYDDSDQEESSLTPENVQVDSFLSVTATNENSSVLPITNENSNEFFKRLEQSALSYLSSSKDNDNYIMTLKQQKRNKVNDGLSENDQNIVPVNTSVTTTTTTTTMNNETNIKNDTNVTVSNPESDNNNNNNNILSQEDETLIGTTLINNDNNTSNDYNNNNSNNNKLYKSFQYKFELLYHQIDDSKFEIRQAKQNRRYNIYRDVIYEWIDDVLDNRYFFYTKQLHTLIKDDTTTQSIFSNIYTYLHYCMSLLERHPDDANTFITQLRSENITLKISVPYIHFLSSEYCQMTYLLMSKINRWTLLPLLDTPINTNLLQFINPTTTTTTSTADNHKNMDIYDNRPDLNQVASTNTLLSYTPSTINFFTHSYSKANLYSKKEPINMHRSLSPNADDVSTYISKDLSVHPSSKQTNVLNDIKLYQDKSFLGTSYEILQSLFPYVQSEIDMTDKKFDDTNVSSKVNAKQIGMAKPSTTTATITTTNNNNNTTAIGGSSSKNQNTQDIVATTILKSDEILKSSTQPSYFLDISNYQSVSGLALSSDKYYNYYTQYYSIDCNRQSLKDDVNTKDLNMDQHGNTDNSNVSNIMTTNQQLTPDVADNNNIITSIQSYDKNILQIDTSVVMNTSPNSNNLSSNTFSRQASVTVLNISPHYCSTKLAELSSLLQIRIPSSNVAIIVNIDHGMSICKKLKSILGLISADSNTPTSSKMTDQMTIKTILEAFIQPLHPIYDILTSSQSDKYYNKTLGNTIDSISKHDVTILTLIDYLEVMYPKILSTLLPTHIISLMTEIIELSDKIQSVDTCYGKDGSLQVTMYSITESTICILLGQIIYVHNFIYNTILSQIGMVDKSNTNVMNGNTDVHSDILYHLQYSQYILIQPILDKSTFIPVLNYCIQYGSKDNINDTDITTKLQLSPEIIQCIQNENITKTGKDKKIDTKKVEAKPVVKTQVPDKKDKKGTVEDTSIPLLSTKDNDGQTSRSIIEDESSSNPFTVCQVIIASIINIYEPFSNTNQNANTPSTTATTTTNTAITKSDIKDKKDATGGKGGKTVVDSISDPIIIPTLTPLEIYYNELFSMKYIYPYILYKAKEKSIVYDENVLSHRFTINNEVNVQEYHIVIKSDNKIKQGGTDTVSSKNTIINNISDTNSPKYKFLSIADFVTTMTDLDSIHTILKSISTESKVCMSKIIISVHGIYDTIETILALFITHFFVLNSQSYQVCMMNIKNILTQATLKEFEEEEEQIREQQELKERLEQEEREKNAEDALTLEEQKSSSSSKGKHAPESNTKDKTKATTTTGTTTNNKSKNAPSTTAATTSTPQAAVITLTPEEQKELRKQEKMKQVDSHMNILTMYKHYQIIFNVIETRRNQLLPVHRLYLLHHYDIHPLPLTQLTSLLTLLQQENTDIHNYYESWFLLISEPIVQYSNYIQQQCDRFHTNIDLEIQPEINRIIQMKLDELLTLKRTYYDNLTLSGTTSTSASNGSSNNTLKNTSKINKSGTFVSNGNSINSSITTPTTCSSNNDTISYDKYRASIQYIYEDLYSELILFLNTQHMTWVTDMNTFKTSLLTKCQECKTQLYSYISLLEDIILYEGNRANSCIDSILSFIYDYPSYPLPLYTPDMSSLLSSTSSSTPHLTSELSKQSTTVDSTANNTKKNSLKSSNVNNHMTSYTQDTFTHKLVNSLDLHHTMTTTTTVDINNKESNTNIHNVLITHDIKSNRDEENRKLIQMLQDIQVIKSKLVTSMTTSTTNTSYTTTINTEFAINNQSTLSSKPSILPIITNADDNKHDNSCNNSNNVINHKMKHILIQQLDKEKIYTYYEILSILNIIFFELDEYIQYITNEVSIHIQQRHIYGLDHVSLWWKKIQRTIVSAEMMNSTINDFNVNTNTRISTSASNSNSTVIGSNNSTNAAMKLQLEIDELYDAIRLEL